MQRILPRGEIEALDHNVIPRLVAPQAAEVFRARAARLRQLAETSPIGDYLRLIATLSDAQHHALNAFTPPEVDEARVDLAQTHGMPPLQAGALARDPAWRGLLLQLLDHLQAAPGLPPAAAEICARLRAQATGDTDTLEAQADVLLGHGSGDVDVAAAPFVMAALQVYWTAMACRFDEARLPVVSPFGVCPVCGGLPVASLIRVGGQHAGYRYLCCSLCSTQWHVVRVKCTTCESTEGIAYQSLEGEGRNALDAAAKAETCDHCHTYRKIFSQEKDLNVDPVADDLATLDLDVLVGEAGFQRASGNPFLWQGREEE